MKGVAKLAAGAGHVAYAERPGAIAGPGEVVIELLAAGICGTDLHIEAGEYPCLPPVTMGHELCGRVVELGPAVDEAWGDARVTAETFFSTCGACRWCRARRPSISPLRASGLPRGGPASVRSARRSFRTWTAHSRLASACRLAISTWYRTRSAMP